VFLIKDRGSSLLSLKKQGTDEKLLQAIGHVPTGFATQPPLECLQAEVSTVKADAMAAEAAVKNLAKSTRNTLAQQAKAAHTLLAKWRVEWPDGEVPASGTLEAAVLKLMTKKHAEQWLDPKVWMSCCTLFVSLGVSVHSGRGLCCVVYRRAVNASGSLGRSGQAMSCRTVLSSMLCCGRASSQSWTLGPHW
jgi:hypothetical protein